MQRKVIIVEPYSSGALLAQRFAKQGYSCIALHLRPLTGKLAASFRAGDFEHSIVHDGDLDTLYRKLDGFDLAAAVPGQEAGVVLADTISDHYDLPRNDVALSLARRDKYIMHEVIGRAGLRAIDQIKTSSFEEMGSWLRGRGRWPVVIKPPLSGGTDGVRICDTLEQAQNAFAEAIERTNLLGFRNEEMLAQELITGTEFVVDAVSCNGHHHVASLSYYRKDRGARGGPIYREMIFVPPAEWERHKPVIDYCFAVLDALGVAVGPSHTEIFLDDEGPVLVESGARLCGAMVPLYLEAVSGNSPLDLAVLSYVDPAGFEEAASKPQTQHSILHIYMLMNGREGRVTGRSGERLLADLPTVRDVYWYVAEGAEVIPTCDLLSSLGLVFLIGPDRAAVAADIERIRRWEEEGVLIEVA